jgi:hypothetical protein
MTVEGAAGVFAISLIEIAGPWVLGTSPRKIPEFFDDFKEFAPSFQPTG